MGHHWMTWMMAFDSWIYDVAFVVLGHLQVPLTRQMFTSQRKKNSQSMSVRVVAPRVCALRLRLLLECWNVKLATSDSTWFCGMSKNGYLFGYIRICYSIDIYIYIYSYTHTYVVGNQTDQTRHICRPSVRKR